MGSLGPRVGGWGSEPKLGPEQPLGDSLKAGRWAGRVLPGTWGWGGSTPEGISENKMVPKGWEERLLLLTGDVQCPLCTRGSRADRPGGSS